MLQVTKVWSLGGGHNNTLIALKRPLSGGGFNG